MEGCDLVPFGQYGQLRIAYLEILAAKSGVGSSRSCFYVLESAKKLVPSAMYCIVSMMVILVPLSAVLITISLLALSVLMALRSSRERLGRYINFAHMGLTLLWPIMEPSGSRQLYLKKSGISPF